MTKKYVTDTSTLIECVVSKLIEDKKIEGTLVIPHAVIAELENQANKGLEIGFIGLAEVQKIRKMKSVTIEFVGNRPTETQIKFAKAGEIDAYIRGIAQDEQATLITADLVQAESAKAFGIPVLYFEIKAPTERLGIEKFFDDHTMSVHIKEHCHVYAKKGQPGAWKLHKVSTKKLEAKEIRGFSKEIIEKARTDPDTFIEISRKGSTIVQYRNYRVVIVRPPVADGWEITVVKPLKKFKLEDYKLPDNVLTRLKEKASGILIVGETGSGKSTFAQSVAEFYSKNNFVVKTLESPRDLQLSDEVTQYSKNFASGGEVHDILFLSRPDYIIFDEVRDTPDFQLFTDLKLGASNVVGVLHASSPIESIQRFVSRLDVGMIPSVVDTIIFVEAGKIAEFYTLAMSVKVPSGMTESDLSRPVIDVRNLTNGKLEYEIYSYGEQTVVIPIGEESKGGLKILAEKEIEREFQKHASHVEVEIVNDKTANVYVPEQEIARIIGSGGKRIEEIQNRLGIHINIEELKKEKSSMEFEVVEEKKNVIIYAKPGTDVDILIDDKFVFSAITSKKGHIRVHKKSNVGRELLRALSKKKAIDVRC